MSEAPKWFKDALIDGLRALMVLHLPGGPGLETVKYTRDVWVRVLWDAPIDWQEETDRRRIDRAFLSLARQADRWPTPRALLEQLPRRPQPRALPSPPMSREQRERNRQRLREMWASLQEAKGK
ncbi:hypothetical protein [Alkalilimnicola sp. S0819]|uniref:hypothetical protein n=1 Tax=Alkalilimnicola sp. S0819 TaxID=2613922 RepID=UPI001261CE80|nr:hypothetical protein [Alkalilimnicola sp. S0819]KAB7624342.1 hypothetical protein F3N43_05910 [Alkalilimnicola sp. S0819]MPQ16167.1 hypothetical protein [Alkalilimnicola sp. S0819]